MGKNVQDGSRNQNLGVFQSFRIEMVGLFEIGFEIEFGGKFRVLRVYELHYQKLANADKYWL